MRSSLRSLLPSTRQGSQETLRSDNDGFVEEINNAFIKSLLPKEPAYRTFSSVDAKSIGSVHLSILGQRNVGKTSIVQTIASINDQKIDLDALDDRHTVSVEWMFCVNDLDSKYITDLRNDAESMQKFYQHDVCDLPRNKSESYHTKFKIFDPHPFLQTSFDNILPSIKCSECLLFVFSIYDTESLSYVSQMLRKCSQHIAAKTWKKKLIIIAANKNEMIEMHDSYQINMNMSHALGLQQTYNAHFVQCSTITHDNIHHIFEYICKTKMRKAVQTRLDKLDEDNILHVLNDGLYPRHIFVHPTYDKIHDLLIIVTRILDISTNIIILYLLYSTAGYKLFWVMLGTMLVAHLQQTLVFVHTLSCMSNDEESPTIKDWICFTLCFYVLSPLLPFIRYVRYEHSAWYKSSIFGSIQCMDFKPSKKHPLFYRWRAFKRTKLKGFAVQCCMESIPNIVIQYLILKTGSYAPYHHLFCVSIAISIVCVILHVFWNCEAMHLRIFYFQWLCYATVLLSPLSFMILITNFWDNYRMMNACLLTCSSVFIIYSAQCVSVCVALSYVVVVMHQAFLFIFCAFNSIASHSDRCFKEKFANHRYRSLSRDVFWIQTFDFVLDHDRSNKRDLCLRILSLNAVLLECSIFENKKLQEYLVQQQKDDWMKPFKNVCYDDLEAFVEDKSSDKKAMLTLLYPFSDYFWKGCSPMTLYMALLTQLLMFAVFTLCLVMYYYLYWIEYVNTVLFVASISVIYWSSRYVFEYNRMVYYVALGETSINCCPKRPSQRALFLSNVEKYYNDCYLYEYVREGVCFEPIVRIIMQYMPNRFGVEEVSVDKLYSSTVMDTVWREWFNSYYMTNT
eukprot:697577_1